MQTYVTVRLLEDLPEPPRPARINFYSPGRCDHLRTACSECIDQWATDYEVWVPPFTARQRRGDFDAIASRPHVHVPVVTGDPAPSPGREVSEFDVLAALAGCEPATVQEVAAEALGGLESWTARSTVRNRLYGLEAEGLARNDGCRPMRFSLTAAGRDHVAQRSVLVARSEAP